jgi:hypothetical protein
VTTTVEPPAAPSDDNDPPPTLTSPAPAPDEPPQAAEPTHDDPEPDDPSLASPAPPPDDPSPASPAPPPDEPPQAAEPTHDDPPPTPGPAAAAPARTPAPPARPAPRITRRAAARAVLAVVVGGSGLFAVQLYRAQTRLDHLRAELDHAAADLETVQTDVRDAHHHDELTRYSIDQTRSAIGTAEDNTTLLQAMTANTLRQMANVQTTRQEVDTARLLVAANANDTRACFDGVSQAVDASRSGDDGASAGALRASADQCARVLAVATGARFPYDFPDPFVLRAGNTYYAYSTNSGAGDVQVIRSTDLTTWQLVGNALANLPPWASPGATWAPAVMERGGRYVVYYTVREAASRHQCISRAVGSSPAGPFLDDSSGPLVCQRDQGGSIDPSPFVGSDGRAFLLWKSEGAGYGSPTLWSQELTADGLGLAGSAHQLLSADRAFERGVVEAPSLLEQGGHYYLLYAAAGWSSADYTTAFATCAGPTGPCLKPTDGRVLTSGSRLAGPGGAEVFRDAQGRAWAAFHAYAAPNVGYPSSRYLHIERVRVNDGRVVIDA